MAQFVVSQVYCLQATFDETIGSHFPFQQGMIDHTPAVPGTPHLLWGDGQAKLVVTLLEVQHFRESVVSVFSFSDGVEEPVRVVCLFDFGDFYPLDSPQAQAGARADNSLFQRPDLLIAEVTTWSDQRHTVGRSGAHMAFEKLAELVCSWSPLQTRIVHYAGFEDMWGSGGPVQYRQRFESGIHLHPQEGPVAEWELTAAIQEYMYEHGYLNPRSVWVGRQGGTLVVFPPVERR